MSTAVTENQNQDAQKPDTEGEEAIPTYDVVLRVRRYNPEFETEAHWDEWPLTMYGTDRVLDALHKVKWEPVSYTHLTLPTTSRRCRSRWSPYH